MTEIYEGMDVDLSVEAARIVGVVIYTQQKYAELRGADENEEHLWPCIVDYRNFKGMGVYYHYDDGDFRFNLFKTLDGGITPHPDADSSGAVIERALIAQGNKFEMRSLFLNDETSYWICINGEMGCHGKHTAHQNKNIALILAVIEMGEKGDKKWI